MESRKIPNDDSNTVRRNLNAAILVQARLIADLQKQVERLTIHHDLKGQESATRKRTK